MSEAFAASLGVNIPQMTKTPGGDYYKDITLGTGTTLTNQANVVVDYVGYLKNGVQFDSGSAVPFDLRRLVFGFGDGMIGMKVGGERLIVIPSDNGYGPYSNGPIPPNSTLVFDVKLRSIP